jgi:hypothetical protein
MDLYLGGLRPGENRELAVEEKVSLLRRLEIAK